MSSIFFKVNETFEQELHTFMKEEGYDSKAEFFRFLIKFYKYHRRERNNELHKASEELYKTIESLHKNGKLPLSSLTHELADL